MRDPMPFLLARLAEDDVVMYDLVAHVQTLPLQEPPVPEGAALVIPFPSAFATGHRTFVIADAGHAQRFRGRFDPRRLECDIESRRRIAEEHGERHGLCATCSAEYPCPTLRCLTWVYAEHVNFSDEWLSVDADESDEAVVVASERLAWIDGDRSIANLLREDVPEDEIASRLGLTLSRVRRTRAYLHTLGGVLPETPEEVIARCVVTNGDRRAMVQRLKTWPYTFGTQAPAPAEGGTTGSWDDVEDALFDRLLSREEYDAIRAAIDATDRLGR